MSRPIAVLDLPRRITDLINVATNIATNLKGNPLFPKPNPTLAVFDADLAALVAAEAAALSRTRGAADARDASLAIVHNDLEHLQDYVQEVADAHPDNARSIIEGAGMAVKRVGAHVKAPITAKLGSVLGTATVYAKSAGHYAAYIWQVSTDQVTWTTAPVTLQSKTSFTGLAAGLTYFFRVRPVTKDGEGDWSEVASLFMN